MFSKINGRVLDTETATLIGSRSDSTWHEGGCHVYRAMSGEIFKVTYGRGGEEVGIALMDYRDGMRFAAEHPVTNDTSGVFGNG